MLLAAVEYVRPSSLADAVAALGSNPNARALAGGQTLINVMKARIASPALLVDLNGLDELRRIALASGGGLEVGAMATYTQLVTSAEVAEARPVVRDVAVQIADVQVRNRGTIGGNVCSNDPTNHLPPLLVALGASFVIRGEGGERTVSAEEFFLGVYMTAVAQGELLTKVTLPPARGGDAFEAVTIGRDGTCIVNAAVAVDGDARIAVGCVAAVPVLVTVPPEDEAVRNAVAGAVVDPPSDVHASAEYRRHLAGVLAVRAVRKAKS